MSQRKQVIVYLTVMLISVSVTAYTLSTFSLLVQSVLSIPYDWKIELAIVLGQLVFQLPFIWRKGAFRIIQYYYNMLCIALLGAVLLWPIILINQSDTQSLVTNLIYFFCVVSIMFLIHMQRVKKLQLPWYLCCTWVLYRLCILPFIIY